MPVCKSPRSIPEVNWVCFTPSEGHHMPLGSNELMGSLMGTNGGLMVMVKGSKCDNGVMGSFYNEVI